MRVLSQVLLTRYFEQGEYQVRLDLFGFLVLLVSAIEYFPNKTQNHRVMLPLREVHLSGFLRLLVQEIVHLHACGNRGRTD